jgi:hypothetical protein
MPGAEKESCEVLRATASLIAVPILAILERLNFLKMRDIAGGVDGAREETMGKSGCSAYLLLLGSDFAFNNARSDLRLMPLLLLSCILQEL